MRSILIAWALLLSSSFASDTIKILQLDGLVEYSKEKGQAWSPINKTTQFADKNQIRVGADSFVDLELPGEIRIRLMPGALVTIDRARKNPNGDTETQLHLKTGRIICASGERTPASKLEVKMSAGVMGVRNFPGEFDVRSDGAIRCSAGKITAVYILAGVAQPALTVLPGQISIPEWNVGTFGVIKSVHLDDLADQIKTLKASLKPATLVDVVPRINPTRPDSSKPK